ncbi:putative nuclease HARBI1 [Conger conger]|uniref:putative nuclease HARBI1 n=1 Tax=Conger conger TaxID=82655 RepID=UPI002A5A5B13|nr:putative nuclease HARBI1 [Conger conger]
MAADSLFSLETNSVAYRLPHSAIQHLIQLVVPQIRRATRRNYALSPEVQLLAALRFYAVGSFQEVVGDGTGLSKASGTLIPLLNPSLVDPSWICRKHFPAVNTQVVVDHDGLIVDIVARWPGSTHDSFVWANSAVGQKAGRGMFGRSIFLGDSGYPLRSYLITPVMNPASPAEEAFNEGHTHTRTHIERVFGRWKARFRCIHRSSGGLRLSPRKSCQVIVVTAMLHNIAVRAGADEPPAVDDDNPAPPPLPNERSVPV